MENDHKYNIPMEKYKYIHYMITKRQFNDHFLWPQKDQWQLNDHKIPSKHLPSRFHFLQNTSLRQHLCDAAALPVALQQNPRLRKQQIITMFDSHKYPGIRCTSQISISNHIISFRSMRYSPSSCNLSLMKNCPKLSPKYYGVDGFNHKALMD